MSEAAPFVISAVIPVLAWAGVLLATIALGAVAIVGRGGRRSFRSSSKAGDDLVASLAEFGDAYALYDRDDRLIACSNTKHCVFPLCADLMVPGVEFETIVRTAAERGFYDPGDGDIETVIRQRLECHREGTGEQEYRLGDGRWMLVRERRTVGNGRITVYSDITRSKDRESALALLIERTRGEGNSFVEAAAEALARGLGYRWAGVSQFDADGKTARMLALWDNGKLVEPFDYPLAGTPCGRVSERKDYCYFPDRVTEEFPGDRSLAARGAVSYQGALIVDSAGHAIGSAVAFNDRPDPSLSGNRELVQLIAGWAGTEFERQRTDAALRDSEGRFRDFVEASSDWLWETDEKLRFTRFASPSGLEISSVLRSRLGRTPIQIRDIDTSGNNWKALRADLTARRPFRNFVFNSPAGGGRIGKFRVNGKPIFDPDGRFLGYRGNASDVTAEFEAEARAQRADALLKDAVESLAFAFALYDADDRLLLCNETFRDWFFRKDPDFVAPGKSFEELLRRFTDLDIRLPEGMSPKKWIATRLKKHRTPGEPLEYQISDGRYVRVIERRIDTGGIVSIHADVTDLKQQQQQAAEKSAHLQIVLDTIGQGISVVDRNLTVVAFNQKFLELLDFPPGLGVPGTSFEAFIRYNAERGEYGPGDVDELVRKRVEMAKRFESHSFERTRPDGTVLEIRGNPTPEGGFVTTYTDITQRKRADEALRLSEERYAMAIAAANDGLWDWNVETNRVFLTPRVQEMLGGDAVGREIAPQDWKKRIHPDDRTRYRATVVAHLRGETDHFECEYRLRHRDDSYLWVLDRGIGRRDEDGRVVRMVGALSDVTEQRRAEQALRRAEEKYRDIFENSVGGIYQSSASGRYLDANIAMARLLGYDSPQELIDDPVDIGTQLCIDPERRTEFLERINREGSIHGFESRVRRRDGAIIWISESARAVRDEHGEIVSIEGMIEDISDRKRMEQALYAAKEQAELANRTKSEFLANMSHELRTPLNAIIGFSEIMVEEMFGSLGHTSYREYAKDIKDSGEHLLNLINDILDVSKAEAGKIELAETEVDVPAVVASSLRLVRERADAAGVEIGLESPGELPLLYADERRLKQILLNLLTNAIKFTPQGGTITVALSASPKTGFLITVNDTGIGMKREDIPRALAPFSQVESQINRRHEGTGLGLPLTKVLVELHGGELDIRSEHDRGTEVTVRLPAERLSRSRLAS